jgi:hypothetical protein
MTPTRVPRPEMTTTRGEPVTRVSLRGELLDERGDIGESVGDIEDCFGGTGESVGGTVAGYSAGADVVGTNISGAAVTTGASERGAWVGTGQ